MYRPGPDAGTAQWVDGRVAPGVMRYLCRFATDGASYMLRCRIPYMVGGWLTQVGLTIRQGALGSAYLYDSIGAKLAQYDVEIGGVIPGDHWTFSGHVPASDPAAAVQYPILWGADVSLSLELDKARDGVISFDLCTDAADRLRVRDYLLSCASGSDGIARISFSQAEELLAVSVRADAIGVEQLTLEDWDGYDALRGLAVSLSGGHMFAYNVPEPIAPADAVVRPVRLRTDGHYWLRAHTSGGASQCTVRLHTLAPKEAA